MSKDSEKKSAASMAREAAFKKRTEAWQDVLAEDAAAAKSEAAKTARLREMRLMKEAADAAIPPPEKPKRSRAKAK